MSAQPAVQTFAWDVVRYHRAIEAGVFTKDDRIELAEGEFLPVSPIGPVRAVIVRRMTRKPRPGAW